MQERKLDGLAIERSTYYPAFGTGTSGQGISAPLLSYRIVRLRTAWALEEKPSAMRRSFLTRTPVGLFYPTPRCPQATNHGF